MTPGLEMDLGWFLISLSYIILSYLWKEATISSYCNGYWRQRKASTLAFSIRQKTRLIRHQKAVGNTKSIRRPAAAETRVVRQGDQLNRDSQLFPSCLSKYCIFRLFLTVAQVSLCLIGWRKNNRFLQQLPTALVSWRVSQTFYSVKWFLPENPPNHPI